MFHDIEELGVETVAVGGAGMVTPPRFEPPRGGWSSAESKKQHQFVYDAVLRVYGDPQRIGCRYIPDFGTTDLKRSAMRHVSGTFARMKPGSPSGDRFYTPDVIQTALSTMPLNEKQALMHQLIGHVIDIREPFIYYLPGDVSKKLLISGLSEYQKEQSIRESHKFGQFMIQQFEARQYVDPQEVVRKINQLKQQMIYQMDILTVRL